MNILKKHFRKLKEQWKCRHFLAAMDAIHKMNPAELKDIADYALAVKESQEQRER